MKTQILIAGILLGTLNAFGGVITHGGHAVDCQGKKLVILDYYDAALPTRANPAPALDVESMTAQQIENLIETRLKTASIFYADQYAEAKKTLGGTETWGLINLGRVGDSNEPYFLPPDCSLKQAAVRQGLNMYLDSVIGPALSPAQAEILRAHEVIYHLGNKATKIFTSEKVRTVIRQLVAKQPNYELLKQSIAALGGAMVGYQQLPLNSTYVDVNDPTFKVSLYRPILVDPDTKELNLIGQANVWLRCSAVNCSTRDAGTYEHVISNFSGSGEEFDLYSSKTTRRMKRVD